MSINLLIVLCVTAGVLALLGLVFVPMLVIDRRHGRERASTITRQLLRRAARRA